MVRNPQTRRSRGRKRRRLGGTRRGERRRAALRAGLPVRSEGVAEGEVLLRERPGKIRVEAREDIEHSPREEDRVVGTDEEGLENRGAGEASQARRDKIQNFHLTATKDLTERHLEGVEGNA